MKPSANILTVDNDGKSQWGHALNRIQSWLQSQLLVLLAPAIDAGADQARIVIAQEAKVATDKIAYDLQAATNQLNTFAQQYVVPVVAQLQRLEILALSADDAVIEQVKAEIATLKTQLANLPEAIAEAVALKLAGAVAPPSLATLSSNFYQPPPIQQLPPATSKLGFQAFPSVGDGGAVFLGYGDSTHTEPVDFEDDCWLGERG